MNMPVSTLENGSIAEVQAREGGPFPGPKLLSGVEALAQGAWQAGVTVATGYPGTPTTGVLLACEGLSEIRCQWAANEKVALEIAIGAAYANHRSLVVLKHVGLNVAADPLYNLAYTGLVGGLVLVVGDDPGAKSSQNEQDTRQVAVAAGLPVLEPSTVQELVDFTARAFDLSETLDLPVIVRVTSPLCFMHDRIRRSPRIELKRETAFAKPLHKYLLIPAFVPDCHRRRDFNLDRFRHGQANQHFDRQAGPSERVADSSVFPGFGIIAAGHSAAVLEEAFNGQIPLLILGQVHPLQEKRIREFADQWGRILVAEEGSHYLETQIRALGIATIDKPRYDAAGSFQLESLLTDELPEIEAILRADGHLRSARSIPLPQVDKRLPGFCAGCPHTAIFHIFRELKLHVVGDIGCSTLGALEPFHALHGNLCMGASIGIMHGYLSAMGNEARSKTVAVLGDSTFFHAGMPALLSLALQKSQGTVFILDNAGSAMTGLQSTSPSFEPERWLSLIRSFGIEDVKVLESLDVPGLMAETLTCLKSTSLSVRVLKGTCVQEHGKLKEGTIYRYVVDQDACTSCGVCLETNCPSFSMTPAVESGKPKIQITQQCVGCGFCQQVCPEDAIIPLSVSKILKPSKTLRKLAGKIPWYRTIRRLRKVETLDRLFDGFEKQWVKRRKNTQP